MEAFLNDLSMRPVVAAEIEAARRLMLGFVHTLLCAYRCGVLRVLRTSEDFSGAALAPDYPVIRWRNDSDVDREARRFLASIATKAPYLQSDDDEFFRMLAGISEVVYREVVASGLGHAYFMEGLAVSFSTNENWRRSNIDCHLRRLTPEATIETSSIQIIHASEPNHLEDHEETMRQRLDLAVRDGSDLWNRRGELFDKIQFCGNVQRRVEGLQYADSRFRALLRILGLLNRFCNGWDRREVDLRELPGSARSESEATVNQFSDERKFMCPDGVKRLFLLHMNLPQAWRIHFMLMPAERMMLIGYVGPHLRTATDPN